MDDHEAFLRQAIELARDNVREAGGRPFGAVLVRDGAVLATGVNHIDATGDPTTHAEIEAVRAACRTQGTPLLPGSVMYASGFPCPMCMSAMHQARVEAVYYAYSNEDGEPYGLSAVNLYEGIGCEPACREMRLEYLPVRLDGPDPLDEWMSGGHSG